jgi:hypothetical protein
LRKEKAFLARVCDCEKEGKYHPPFFRSTLISFLWPIHINGTLLIELYDMRLKEYKYFYLGLAVENRALI